MNLYVYETDHCAVVVDYGVMFADSQMCGIDSILPDISYLHQIREKLKAILITHGHEDHVGGIWDMVENFGLPIYTGRFTAELITHKISCMRETPQVTVISPMQEYDFEGIAAQFFPVAHSIPDTFGIILNCGGRVVAHLSDFSGDKNVNFLPDILKREHIFALMLDSTNAVKSGGAVRTEADVAEELIKIMSEAQGKVFFTTFASNVERIGSVIAAARKTDRKIVIEGAAMERTVGIASRLGLISLSEDLFITAKKAHHEEPGSLVYILSGCQGEYGSALHTVAAGERRSIQIQEGDALIFSSRVIPGNERNINNIVNGAMRKGVKVIQADDRLVHVSGHANAEQLLKVIAAVSPEYFIPIHGEYRHMAANAGIAEQAGLEKEQILIFESGTQLEFTASGLRRLPVPSAPRYFDNKGGFILDEAVYTTRKYIARDGVVILHIGESIKIDTVGFPFAVEDERAILSAVMHDSHGAPDEQYIDKVRRVTKKYYKKYMSRRPVIIIYSNNNGIIEKTN